MILFLFFYGVHNVSLILVKAIKQLENLWWSLFISWTRIKNTYLKCILSFIVNCKCVVKSAMENLVFVHSIGSYFSIFSPIFLCWLCLHRDFGQITLQLVLAKLGIFMFFLFFSSIFETLSHWNHILWCSINGNSQVNLISLAIWKHRYI